MQALVIDGVAHELGPMEGYVLPGGVETAHWPRGRTRAGRVPAGVDDYRSRWRPRRPRAESWHTA
jgi:hypothetical protein